MIREVGYCNGIENYSRHLSGKRRRTTGNTSFIFSAHRPREYSRRRSHSVLEGQESSGRSEDSSENIPGDFLTIIDESHVTLPQLQGMYAGDASRKNTLVEYGFRLPSAKDNRPLKYEEFSERIGPVIYTSATPSEQERTQSGQIVEQIIRPTGLVDPEISFDQFLRERPEVSSPSLALYLGRARKFWPQRILLRGYFWALPRPDSRFYKRNRKNN